MYRAADVAIQSIPVALRPGLRLGYVQGVGDNVADALRDLGIPVEMIDPAALPVTDLSRFTTIVVGPRAYQANQTLIDNNAYLLDYVKRGGNLVVQYGQNEMQTPGIMPYPITLSRPAARVTIEQAPVTVIEPRSSLLDTPNVIGPADFEGWVQERATYMPSTFDPHYQTVLSMNDPGEPPESRRAAHHAVWQGTLHLRDARLVQTDSGRVPGGVRIFANLLR